MKKIDWTIWLGAFVGIAAIAAGAWLEDLSLGFLWHPAAALIVGGGTLGAVIIRRGIGGVSGAIQAVWNLRHADDGDETHQIELAKLAWLSRSANKTGVKAFENHADNCGGDALVAQGMILLAERADKERLVEVLTRRLEWEDDCGLHDAATLDAAGGFSPTFGILGAVLGLIGVLRVLDQPSALGAGIATAFVATIYGIGLANLFFFPLAARLRHRHEASMKRREEIVTVILSLAAGDTPRSIINRFNLKK